VLGLCSSVGSSTAPESQGRRMDSFERAYSCIFRNCSWLGQQLGNLLSLCREIAGARDILQKFENLKKQHEWNFN
jgi:hypothetical protein